MMARYRRPASGKLIASAVAAGIGLAVLHGHVPAGSGGGGALTAANSTVALGQQLASAYGWGTGAQWTCLDELWTRESGWQMVWNYAGSGAYGIPQALPASKMAAAGPDRHLPDRVAGAVRLDHQAAAGIQGDVAGRRVDRAPGVEDQVTGSELGAVDVRQVGPLLLRGAGDRHAGVTPGSLHQPGAVEPGGARPGSAVHVRAAELGPGVSDRCRGSLPRRGPGSATVLAGDRQERPCSYYGRDETAGHA